MSHGKSDEELIKNKHNTARFFVEKRQVSWVLLIATCVWGVYAYTHMPQRKDPEVQVRTAVALVPWPGASAEKIEQLVTKKVEEQMAANTKVTKIESISRTGLAVIYVELDEKLFQVHAGAKRFANTSEDQHASVIVIAEVLQHRRHVLVELRTHGVALLRPVETNGGDAILLFDEHCLVSHAIDPYP